MTNLPDRPKQAHFRTTLKESISATETANVKLTNVPSYASGGEVIEVTILDPANIEPISVTGWDANTGLLSGVTRGLPRYTGGPSTASDHGAGVTVIIGMSWQLLDRMNTALDSKVDVAGDTFTGAMKFANDSTATFTLPVMTTAERDAVAAPENGMFIFNETVGIEQIYKGGSWQNSGAGGAAAPLAANNIAGLVDLATTAEIGAGTNADGISGAINVLPVNVTVKTSSGAGDENKIPVLNASGQLAAGFIKVTDVFPTGSVLQWVTNTAPTGFVLCDGSEISNTTYTDLMDVLIAENFLFGVGTNTNFTADSGTDTCTSAGHGLNDDDVVYVRNSGGGLPGGLTADTKYFVINSDPNTFQLSLTSGGAAINITSNGTGTQNFYSTFTVPDLRGRFPLGQDDMGGSSANRVTSANADTLGLSDGAETHTLTIDEMPAHSHDILAKDSLGSSTVASSSGVPDNTQSTESEGGGQAHNNMPPYLTLNYILKT